MAGAPPKADGTGAGGWFWALLAAAFVVVALGLRTSTFGDPDRQVDEAFYWLVGQRMHGGALPYVDVWDRKPLGLFAIYWALAGLGQSVWIYQVAACLSAGATALVVARLVVVLAGEGHQRGGGFSARAGGAAAGLLLARGRCRRSGRRWLLVAALAVWALVWETPPPPAQARETARAMDAMAGFVRAHDPGGGLLVLDGPPLLYAASGERFLTPLVFPNRLDHAIEADVSHLATSAEIDRVLAAGPGVIAMARTPRNQPVNAAVYARVRAYTITHCNTQWQAPAIGRYADNPILFVGDCRRGTRVGGPAEGWLSSDQQKQGNGGRSKD